MATVDDLTLVLDLMILFAASVFYTGFFVWLHTRRGDIDRANAHLLEGSLIMGLIGAAIGLIALWSEFEWPLTFGTNTAYNPFFFDPLLMLAVLSVAFTIAVWNKLPTHFVGMLGVVMGGGVLYYGVRADQLGLTKDPFETFLMYVAFGCASILSYGATLFVDWFVIGPKSPAAQPMASDAKPAYPMLWNGTLGLFLLAIALAGVASMLYGFDAAWSHLIP
jgi:uncharacterized membrane protein